MENLKAEACRAEEMFSLDRMNGFRKPSAFVTCSIVSNVYRIAKRSLGAANVCVRKSAIYDDELGNLR
mgnify:FL=1